MKIKSTHEVTVTREELATALGFTGRVKDSIAGTNVYTFTIEGENSPAPTVHAPPVAGPAPMASTQERTSVSSRATLTIEFSYSDNDHGDKGEAYAEELKLEIQKMLARSPEPGITTQVGLVFSG